MAYTCNDPVCDPCCDFCWFCAYDEYGAPIYCEKGFAEEFGTGTGYCDLFQCRLHEPEPPEKKSPIKSSISE